MERNLADHVVALSEAIDTVKEVTGRDVHLAGYSQGGMFCYQTAAYRRSKDLASIIAFGSPVDTLAALPMNLPAGLAAGGRGLHGRPRLQPHRHPGLAGAHRVPDARPDQDRPVAAGLPAPAARPRGAAAARAAAAFPASEGWIAWSGPAISELLKQFIAHNRMMTGGFSIHGDLVTLSDINCPVLAVVGEVDDIGQPASVRGIKRAAPQADVYEFLIRAGHFGLVVGSKAATQTWPTVAQWVKWIDGDGDMPEVSRRWRCSRPNTPKAVSRWPPEWRTAPPRPPRWPSAWPGPRPTRSSRPTSRRGRWPSRRSHAAEAGPASDRSTTTPGSRSAASCPSRPATRPTGECLLFDGRVHTYEAVDRRINNVVRGLIEVGVRQGAHVGCADGDPAQRARRDRRAVAAGRGGGADAARRRPGDRGAARRGVGDHRRPEQSRGGPRAVDAGAGARRRRVARPAPARTTPTSSTWRRSTPTRSTCPAGTGPTRGWPATWRSSRSARSAATWRRPPDHQLRWALSAFGTASAANLGRGDTVYCLTPLHHQSGLLVSLGGAVVGGAASRCREACGRTGSCRRSASTA